MREKILRNAARCLFCHDLIESKYRHDFVTCCCGAISVDGGLDYLRRVGNLDAVEERSVIDNREDHVQRMAEDVWELLKVEDLYATIRRHLDEEREDVLASIEKLGAEKLSEGEGLREVDPGRDAGGQTEVEQRCGLGRDCPPRQSHLRF